MKEKIFGLLVCIIMLLSVVVSVNFGDRNYNIKKIEGKNLPELNSLGENSCNDRDDLLYVENGSTVCNFYWRDQNDMDHFLHISPPNNTSNFKSNADWDGDGLDDYIYTIDSPSKCSSKYIIKTATGGTKSWTERRPIKLDFGDWNGDGKDDLIYYYSIWDQEENKIDYYFQWKDQNQINHEIPIPEHFDHAYYFASNGDWDGDGKDDFTYLTYDGIGYSNLYLVNNDGTVTTWEHVLRIVFVDFADWDGDGLDELIYIEKSYSSYKIIVKDQDGSNYEIEYWYPSCPTHFASHGDWDGDGLDDCVYVLDNSSGNSDIFLVENDGGRNSWLNKPEIFYIDLGNWDTLPNVPSDPSPAHNSIDVRYNIDLRWTGGDKDEYDYALYDVYFGKTNSPPKVASNIHKTKYDPGYLDFDTKYYWKIISWDHKGAYSEGPVWCFTTESEPSNYPPEIINEKPIDFSRNVSKYISEISVLIKDPEGDSFNWSIETVPDIGNSNGTYEINGTKTCKITQILEPVTTYKWIVNATDIKTGRTVSEIFTFTTLLISNAPPSVPSDPDPENESCGNNINVKLSWSCIDPEGRRLSYDVYFGNNSNPPLVAPKIQEKTYDPGLLEYGKTYYWKIIVWDFHGIIPEDCITVEGPVWSFMTRITNLAPNKPSNPMPNDGEKNVVLKPEFSVYVSDPENDPLNVIIYLKDMPIFEERLIPSGSTISFEFEDYLEFETTYYWHVEINDIFLGTKSDTWSFTTVNETEGLPTIEIIKPEKKGVYLNNNKMLPFFNTIVIGSIDIEILVENPYIIPIKAIKIIKEKEQDDGVANDDIIINYIPGVSIYTWTYNERTFSKKLIKVELLYDGDKEISDEVNPFIINFAFGK